MSELMTAVDVARSLMTDAFQSPLERCRAAKLAGDWSYLLEVARSTGTDSSLRLWCAKSLLEQQATAVREFAQMATQIAASICAGSIVLLDKPEQRQAVAKLAVDVARRLQVALADD